jgi:predicted NBD/HSP70 family sugar kinase
MIMDRRYLPLQRAREIQVLAIVDERGVTTRRALAGATGIRPASLNRLVAAMVERGLLRNVDHLGTGRRGRPEGRVALRPDAGAVVGLEFGREHLAGAVVDATGALRHVDETLPVPRFEAGAATMDAIVDAARALEADAGLRPGRVRALGIALHDVVTAEGAWRTVDRPGRPGFDVKGELARRLDHPVLVEDVSRAFAEAEHRFGAGQGVPDMIYVFIGSHGVGGGIFVNGSMLVSSSGICGEIGHVVVEEDGALCQCGSYGCFETVASHRAVVARFTELVDHGVTTSLAPPVTFADICAAAGAGDSAACLVLRELADAMGRALGATVNLVGAPTIVIGGAVRLAGDAFLEHVRVALRQRVVSGLSAQVAVRYAHLPSHAGAWGVAVKARDAAIWGGGFLDASPIA